MRRQRIDDGAETIGATDFKRRCLEILERVRRHGHEIVVTKRGRPIARLSPLQPGQSRLRGMLRGQMTIHGDLVHLDFSDDWDAAR